MILFQQRSPWPVMFPTPYHIIKGRGWRNNFIKGDTMTLVYNAYCGEDIPFNLKNKKLQDIVKVDKKTRKEYTKQVCKECKISIIKSMKK